MEESGRGVMKSCMNPIMTGVPGDVFRTLAAAMGRSGGLVRLWQDENTLSSLLGPLWIQKAPSG